MVEVISTSSIPLASVQDSLLAQYEAQQANTIPLSQAQTSLTNQYIQNQYLATQTTTNTMNSMLSAIQSSLLQSASLTNSTLSGIANIIRSDNFNQSNLLNAAIGRLTSEFQTTQRTLGSVIQQFVRDDTTDITSFGEAAKTLRENTELIKELLSDRENSLQSQIDDIRTIFNTTLARITGLADSENIELDSDIGDIPFFLEPFRPVFELFTFIGRTIDYLANRFNDTRETISTLEDGDYNKLDDFYSAFYGTGVSGDIISAITTLIGFFPFLIEVLQTSYAKANTELDFLVKRTTTPNRIREALLVVAFRRGDISETNFFKRMADLGYSENESKALLKFDTQYPTVNEIVELYRRGSLSEQNFKAVLEQIGIDPNWTNLYEQLTWFIPPVQDVIRFAVRDVYEPEVVRDGGLLEELPQSFLDDAKLAGLKPEQARLYWAAHWTIPSLEMGFEMFQRAVIDRNRLDNLFKAADVAPNWRDALLQIAYKIPTRVDTRRMYEDGVIDDTTLKRYLLDYGYNPSDMEKVFQWYQKRKEAVQSRDELQIRKLALAMVLKSYKRGILERHEAVTKLTYLGYLLPDVGVLLDNADYELAEQNEEDFTKDIAKRLFKYTERAYLHKTIDSDRAISMLTDSGLGSDEANAYIALWDLELELDRKESLMKLYQKSYIGWEIDSIDLQGLMIQSGFSEPEARNYIQSLEPFRNMRTRDLSRADIRKAFAAGIIDETEAINQLRSSGYSDKDIFIIAQIDGLIRQ